MKEFSIIVALDHNMGIAREGGIPWYLPENQKYFERITKTVEDPKLQNVVVMGSGNWEEIFGRKPLPGRINAVISSNPDLDLPEGVLQFLSLDEALLAFSTSQKINQIFVIGGAELFTEAILHPKLERLYITKIEEDYDCDQFFPEEIPLEFDIISATETLESDGLEYSFIVLEKNPDLQNEYFLPDQLI